ncbi:phosphoglycerol transferase MdoB-like AlkP superfamily enzyme [Gelidibacter algens]|uniref:Phosphoglycerol transferase MdoB-like AlkP superfamily enzyme n=1 Tax=Gelidibacter algens TaxID=49280 RepID=A0A1A7QR80_9FLAO|nr:alkaline phosphatase family protein [Gelidibacter algens]OBX22006.1 sulfatase [Gelidibacter algens]RAJ27820.1 phosphoglycerol transferase MdoB-like AlkP superfamily enzyme [Gelidibacter algens]
MKLFFRKQEYTILLYRLFLAYAFYFLARFLFFLYNYDVLEVHSVSEFFRLSYYGLAFDTAAILYVNLLFILLSIIPLRVTTSSWYRKLLLYVYFSTNLIAYALNFVDFIYYKFNFARTTLSVLDVVKNEGNKTAMFFRFMVSYWHVYVLFILVSVLWVYLYKRVKIHPSAHRLSTKTYYISSAVGFVIIGTFIVGGIRGGDFKKSTRPINLVDASKHVNKMEQADLVLNTTFAFIRTFNNNSFKKVDYDVTDEEIQFYIKPIKHYENNPSTKPNIVVIITESMGREYLASFNKDIGIDDYVGYTPFLDSLAQHSLIFPNAFANGSKSIHGMSSVLSGIPSFADAFTSSSYSNQEIQSLVSVLNDLDYDTSFFHGAPNGSMGFLGFSNILGFDHYYGMEDYGNDDDFDGSWGIWDEPFLQFMKSTLDQKIQPFFSTVFTVSSHEPFNIPEKYDGKFPEGHIPMHEPVGYTDYAFKQFFEAAKKEPWFDNTIFVITADHCNQVYYDVYNKVINRRAVPILFYKSDGSLVGSSNELAQQIDIYPTLMDIIGYDQPFRSWGRSLISKDGVEPFAINYNASQYHLQRGNYICTFDGKQATGFYDINDKSLENNLIANKTPEMEETEKACKAFLEDYFERIVDKRLSLDK